MLKPIFKRRNSSGILLSVVHIARAVNLLDTKIKTKFEPHRRKILQEIIEHDRVVADGEFPKPTAINFPEHRLYL